MGFLYATQITLVLLIVVLVFFQRPPDEGFQGFGASFNADSGYKKNKLDGIKKFTLLIGFLFMGNSLLLVKLNIKEQQNKEISHKIDKKSINESSKKEVDFDVKLD